MNTLSQYKNEELRFIQPSVWKRVYELRASDVLLMKMSYPKIFSTLTVVEGFGETWEVYRPSVWKNNFEIRKAGATLPFAKLAMKKIGCRGTFELPLGERLHYVFSVWKGRNEIQSVQGHCLVKFHRRFSLKPLMNVLIEQQSPLIDKYPWVLMTAYRLIIERRSQAVY